MTVPFDGRVPVHPMAVLLLRHRERMQQTRGNLSVCEGRQGALW